MKNHFLRFSAGIIAISICLSSSWTAAVEPKSMDIPLWDEGAPGALGKEAKDIPKAMVRLPASDRPTPALVICPGGGYGALAMGHEGNEIAQWANKLGIAAIICDYRHRGKGYGHPAPLQDAQRAIRLTRAKAKEWNIDSSRVGILGFSAGGHLTSTVLTRFDSGDAESSDSVARESSRPDFGVLAYPVILFGESKGHRGSEKNLLGSDASADELRSFQSALNVTSQTPPTFLFHTMEDTVVPPENSLAFYSAMVKNGVPGELHIYEKGKHGVGLGKSIEATGDWSSALERWLKSRQILND